MPEKMFTKEEAVTFLQDSWGIKDVDNRMKNDRKSLLDEIAVNILNNVPFQSVTLMATPPEELPSLETIKKNCMTGIGGLCYTLSTFTWGLLRGLEFDARMQLATVTSTVTSPNNHLLVLVTGVEDEGDLYLVDCGTGFPIFRAIPLDFDQESPVYQDGFLEYKYVRHDGKILRMHGNGDMIKRNDPPVEGLDFYLGRWRRFYSFSLEQTSSVDDVGQAFTITYTTNATYFSKSPRALWFPRNRAVVIVNNRFIFENEKGEMVPRAMKSDDEIFKTYQEHFPLLKQDLVRRAIEEWHHLSK